MCVQGGGRSLIAMWPSPPSPRMPTLSPSLVCCTSGVQTVCPPHSSGAYSGAGCGDAAVETEQSRGGFRGAVCAESHASGMAKQNLPSCMRT